jgi:cytosine/adenosine deaminase-related metal-dependent hydrolase
VFFFFVFFVFFVSLVRQAVGAFCGERTLHRARWVLPISEPPIEDGWIEIADGRIVAVGDSRAGLHAASSAPPSIAILPGLVNAHTHLELSWMRGQVPPAASMTRWVERLLSLRGMAGNHPVEPIADAIREARSAGTTLVGDITNTLAAYEPLADSELSAAVLRELLGFNPVDAGALVQSTRQALGELTPLARLRPSIVPHAPYSVAPSLLRAIAAASDGAPTSIHLGESPEEIEFLRWGTGPWRDLLMRLGVWSDSWTAPGQGPVDYIAAHGLLNERLLAVHCVQLTDEELAMLARARATVVTCPRSNRWVGAGLPPVERFYRSGVRVAVGTDSLASVDDLNVFSELKVIRELAPGVPAGEILASATRHGADALGFGRELGTIEPGKRAELIAVAVPDDVSDVEEYLLSGISPSQVGWLPETPGNSNLESRIPCSD